MTIESGLRVYFGTLVCIKTSEKLAVLKRGFWGQGFPFPLLLIYKQEVYTWIKNNNNKINL